MKLYTEEQVKLMLNRAKIFDGEVKDNFVFILSEQYILSLETPIELPTDWEIEQFAEDSFHTCTDDLHYEGIILGAKWVIDKIKNQQ